MNEKSILLFEKVNSNNMFYKRELCRFVFCNSCFWIATLLKDIMNIVQCPECNSRELFVNQIFKKMM